MDDGYSYTPITPARVALHGFDEGYRAGLLKAAEIAEVEARQYTPLSQGAQASQDIAAAIRAAEKEK